MQDFELTDPRLWFYRARIKRVVDGDTVIAVVDRGFTDFSVKKFRLAGVDAPLDRRSAAQRRLSQLIEGKEVLVKAYRTAKLDRWLLEIFLPPSWTTTANDLLIAEGLANSFTKPR